MIIIITITIMIIITIVTITMIIIIMITIRITVAIIRLEGLRQALREELRGLLALGLGRAEDDRLSHDII